MLVHEMKRVECHDPTCVRASRAHTHVVLTGRRFEEESLDDAPSSAHPPRETPDSGVREMDDPQNRKPATKGLVVRTVQEARQLMLATDARLMTPQIQEYWLHMEMEQQKIEMAHIITYVSCGVPRSRVCKGGSA